MRTMPRARSGNELLDGGTDGSVGRGGSLIQAEQRRLMLGGSKGDQDIVSGSAEDLAGSYGGQKLLVASACRLVSATDPPDQPEQY